MSFPAAVDRVREHIAAGDVYQVNLTDRFEGSYVGDAAGRVRGVDRRAVVLRSARSSTWATGSSPRRRPSCSSVGAADTDHLPADERHRTRATRARRSIADAGAAVGRLRPRTGPRT